MNESLCGKRIKMNYNGVTEYATIVDMVRKLSRRSCLPSAKSSIKCPGCEPWALDLSKGLFPDFAPLSEGVIYGDWTFV